MGCCVPRDGNGLCYVRNMLGVAGTTDDITVKEGLASLLGKNGTYTGDCKVMIRNDCSHKVVID